MRFSATIPWMPSTETGFARVREIDMAAVASLASRRGESKENRGILTCQVGSYRVGL